MRPHGSWAAPVIVAALAATLIAGAGTTVTELGPWYRSLQQPSWTPPDWAFGAIWTAIFALAAISAVTAWRAAPTDERAFSVIGQFAFNGFLNLLWSFLFFKLQRPDWALFEVALLWLSIAALIISLWRFSRLASLLLVPYLIWVSVAAALNWQIVQLNGPFG
jgi:translocator protein